MKITLLPDMERRIAMIKEFRNLFGTGLKEAKNFVEALCDSHQFTLEIPAIASIFPDENTINNSVYFRVNPTNQTIIKEIQILAKQCIECGSYNIAKDLINILEEN